MAVFNFTVALYAFDQWTGAATNNTVSYPNGTSFTLGGSPTLSVLQVQDDDGNPAGSADNLFSDGFIDTPGDGSSPSTANNDQLLTQPITLNGVTYPAGSQVELEFGFTTTSGDTFWVIRIDGTNVGISGPVLPTPGTTYTVASSADGQATPFDNVPCFTDGAMVKTPHGRVAIEELRVGDMVCTLDSGAQPILWWGIRDVTPLELLFFPMMRPVLIKAGAFGPNCPNADMVVSPQHKMLIRSGKASLLFGEEEVFATAHSLIDGDRIDWARDNTTVRYRHLLLPKHEVLTVNGAPTESLFISAYNRSPREAMELDLSGTLHPDAAVFARRALRSFEARLLVA